MRSLNVAPATLILMLAACQGPPGPPGISAYEIVVGETALDSSATKQLQVDCPTGKRALGAGWSVLDSTSAILSGRATYFQPTFDGSHGSLEMPGRPRPYTGSESCPVRPRA